jgi:hypothetical protein
MAAPRAPLFLERQGYRRRRLMDAARVLPVAGMVALLLPVLWTGDGQTSTASEGLYMFGLWLALIVAALALSRPLRAAIDREKTPPTAGALMGEAGSLKLPEIGTASAVSPPGGETAPVEPRTDPNPNPRSGPAPAVPPGD